MSVTVSTVGSGSVATPAASAAFTGAQSTTSATTNSTSSSDPSGPIKYYVDALAGPVTQFLNIKGDVQDQIPSATVVAYLKAGLTTDGRSKLNETSTIA